MTYPPKWEPAWVTSRAKQLKYLRRRPEETSLYHTVYQCRNELEWEWEQRYQPEYGCLRDEVLTALDAYPDCGLLAHGGARARCEKCSHSRLIAFSCKKRGSRSSVASWPPRGGLQLR